VIVHVIIFLVISCVLAGSLSAASESYCLRPVAPYPGDWHIRYTEQLHKRIEPQIHTFAQMRVQPAFEGEYSVSIHGVPDNLRFWQATKCFISYYSADKNIWSSMPENNGDKQQREVSVATATVDIPLPVAKRIYTVWHKMLLKTRYAEDEFNAAPDPTTVEFSSESLYGETYYPAPCKSAGLLIELGERLIDYCKAPPEKRAAATKALEVQAKALEDFLRHHS
jgi:hypothetical protein